MDFRWSYDEDCPATTAVSLLRHEPPNTSCSAIVFNSIMDTVVSHPIDYSGQYSNSNADDQIEIDIESISLSHLEGVELKNPPYQHILSDLVHSSVQMEEYLREKSAAAAVGFDPEPVPQKESAEDWQYVQYSGCPGSPYRLAVNNEMLLSKQEENNAPNQLLELTALPCEEQQQANHEPEGQLYHLLTNPENPSLQEETTTEDSFPYGIDNKDDMILLQSPIKSEPETKPIIYSADEVGPSPSIPEAATSDPASQTIGPYCTAVGIFALDLSLDVLPHDRNKLTADQLKNGTVLELHNRMIELKSPRRSLLRVLSVLFDIPYLDHQSPRVVDRFFRRVIMPLRAERTELVKRYALSTSRNNSQSKWRLRNNFNPDVIAQFDSAVFLIPQITDEPPRRYGTRPSSGKEPKSRERKPTQAQQLHQLQSRFDAFRHAQRKHNAAFLRHISIVQKKLDRVLRPKHSQSNRRHSTTTTTTT